MGGVTDCRHLVAMPRQSSRLRGIQAEDDNQGQDPPPAPQNWQEILAEMEARLKKTEEELSQRRQPAPPPATELPPPPRVVPAPVQPVTGNRLEPLYERFRKQQPPTFEGGADPLLAEQWMGTMSVILDFMRVEGRDRVDCASYMLRNDARIWWEVVGQRRDTATMTWEEFKSIFNEKYYSVAVRAAKSDEFNNLTQCRLSVTEYALIFDRLAKFAPELVPTDAARRDRFIRGLNVMIARDVSITMTPESTYAQVVDKALTAERAEDQILKDDTSRRDTRRVVPSSSGPSRGGGPSDQKRRVPDSFTPYGSDRRVRGFVGGR